MDPAFESAADAIQTIAEIACQTYHASRKSPRTRKAGAGFADPNYDLSVDCLAAKAAVEKAQRLMMKSKSRRILIVNASSRSEHTCPAMSKNYRLAEIALEVFEAGEVEIAILDLSRLASGYGRNIFPCKACFSTAAELCHWLCFCYPNHSLGQTQDWMNEIYPMWVAAHGVMIITPVNWYQVTSPLKLLMDRLVCADGGKSDPSSTHGKDAKEAKELELEGWDYPRHLAGRLFSVIVHGDTRDDTRRTKSRIDRYIGYWKPHATSHDDLDQDSEIQQEVRNAARTLLGAVFAQRNGQTVTVGHSLEDPRPRAAGGPVPPLRGTTARPSGSGAGTRGMTRTTAYPLFLSWELGWSDRGLVGNGGFHPPELRPAR